MARSVKHRISATLLVVLMIVSSSGFSMDIHFCQNEIKSISIFGKAKNCHEKPKSANCHASQKMCHHSNMNSGTTVDMRKCCHNKTWVKESLDTDAQAQVVSFSEQVSLVFLVTWISVISTEAVIQLLPSYQKYKPPVLDGDLRILYQTFLI